MIVGSVFGNQVGSSFDDGFVDIVGTYAVVKLDMGFELDLRHGYIVEALCCSGNDAVDFIEVDRLQTAVALGHF